MPLHPTTYYKKENVSNVFVLHNYKPVLEMNKIKFKRKLPANRFHRKAKTLFKYI